VLLFTKWFDENPIFKLFARIRQAIFGFEEIEIRTIAPVRPAIMRYFQHHCANKDY